MPDRDETEVPVEVPPGHDVFVRTEDEVVAAV
jgi:hypothetical protein